MGVLGLDLLVQQVARWATEAHLESERFRLAAGGPALAIGPPQERTPPTKTKRRVHREPVWDPASLPPARLDPTGVACMGGRHFEFLLHRIWLVKVEHRNGREAKGALAYCSVCGAFFWQQADALLRPCMGRKQAGLATQLSRIRRGLFPSAAQIYLHLRVGAPRLPSGPEPIRSEIPMICWRIARSTPLVAERQAQVFFCWLLAVDPWMVPTDTYYGRGGGDMGDRPVALTWSSAVDGRPAWPSD